MLFNSFEYLVFFLSILALSWLLVGLPRLRIWVILIASFYFYFSNNGWVIALLFICMQIDYVAALWIERSESAKQRKAFLAISMATNIGILAFFKYFNFFASSVTDTLNFFGYEAHWDTWKIILPVGISFYTFESMSYTIDVYRRLIPAEKSWYRFAFFVAYFPHLIAGPILRPKQFLPQLDARPYLKTPELEEALFTIAKGLVKKIVLADYLAIYADRAFNYPQEVGIVGAWVGVLAFTFQIYFDFSGYTDVATGCAGLMGFRLPVNFNKPYISESITEFWRRWHISLSTWLRDYLYVPLGGNRMATQSGIYRNLMITMLLGGLWHGAAWHFVIWGFLQGFFMVMERHFGIATADEDRKAVSARVLLRQLFVFALINLSWIVFRVESSQALIEVFKALVDFDRPWTLSAGMVVCLCIVSAGWLVQLSSSFFDYSRFFLRVPIPIKGMAYAGIAAAVIILGSEGAKTFIYFQF